MEEKFIGSGDTDNHIKVGKRYVDDEFAILNKHGDLDLILDRFNTYSETVKITLEKEKNNHLSFIDVEMVRTEDRFHTKIYMKKRTWAVTYTIVPIIQGQ